jgi:hypothetical protein
MKTTQSHSENLDAVIRNYRDKMNEGSVGDEEFKLMILGAVLIDGIFTDNQDHSKRVDFRDIESSDPDTWPTNLHDWRLGEDGMFCFHCGTLHSDCGANSQTWICPEKLVEG